MTCNTTFYSELARLERERNDAQERALERLHLINKIWEIAAKFPSEYCNAIRDPIHEYTLTREAVRHE